MTETKEHPVASASPARNFTLTVAERVAALMAGPPAYALRLRKIEDLERAIVEGLVEHEAREGWLVDPRTGELPVPIAARLAEMNRLIADHNRYYPIEKQLPSDPRTRQVVEWGVPWQPMAEVAAEAMLDKARSVRG